MILPQIGDVVADKYRIEEVLGEGGYGRVYRGTTDLSGRVVAVKVLKPGRQGYDLKRTQRFFRELRAIAKLQSPFTLTLFDYGQTEGGILYMVTEYIDGHDLNELLAIRGTLSEGETTHILMQLLMSLEEAHNAGILHRDIKPSNIRLFEYQGDPLRAKLLDFGLARSLRADEARLTSTGNVIGTPRFMSPEQIRDETLTPASDLFSLGLVALECIVGGGAVSLSQPVRELSASAAVSDGFRAVVNGMLAVDRDERIQSARAAYDALRQLRHGQNEQPTMAPQPPVAPPPAAETRVRPHRPPAAPPRHSRRVLMLAAAAFAVVAIAGVAWSMLDELDNDPGVRPGLTQVRDNPLAAPDPPPKLLPDSGHPSAPPAPAVSNCGTAPGIFGEVLVSTRASTLSAGQPIQVYVPRGYDGERRHPVIVAFHDYGSGPWGVMRRSRLQTLADEHDVLIVAVEDEVRFPAGIWESTQDVERARDAVDQVMRTFCVDPNRIFGYGHGSGGRAVALLPCAFPGIAASATTAFRSAVGTRPTCKLAVPHLSIDPQLNPSAPAAGGAACGRFAHSVASTEDDERSLRRRAKCSLESERWFDHEHGSCRKWSCAVDLVTCRVQGGREFPGAAPRSGFGVEPECDGEPVDFPYTETIWRFFEEVAPADGAQE